MHNPWDAYILEDFSNRENIKNLYNSGIDEKLFVKKLFYNEVMRTGLQYKEGSYLSYFPNELIESVSEGISEMIGSLKELNKVVKLDDGTYMANSNFFNTESEANSYIASNPFSLEDTIGTLIGEGFNESMNDLIAHMGLATSSEQKNNKIPKSKSISFNVNDKQPQYNSALSYAVKRMKGNDKLNGQELRKAQYDIIEEVFNIKFSNKDTIIKNFTPDSKIFGDTMKISIPSNPAVSYAAAKLLGIRVAKVEKELYFRYPVIYKIGLESYQLYSVDGIRINIQNLMKYDSETQINDGKSAIYKKVDSEILKSKGSYNRLSI
jgi:hypothetical protein